jgi:hypothetical protein
MRYLSFFKSVERDTPPTESEIATMTTFIAEAASAGWLLSTEGCLPSALGARVRREGGDVTVLDGPFTEAKEVIGGFAIMQANSKEEMIALTKRFLEVVGDGECEIRQLYEEPALDSAAAHETVSGATRSA